MDGEQVLQLILPAWRAGLPPRLAGDPLDSYIRRNRPRIVAQFDAWSGRREAVREWARGLDRASRRRTGQLAAQIREDEAFDDDAAQLLAGLGFPSALKLWVDYGSLAPANQALLRKTLLRALDFASSLDDEPTTAATPTPTPATIAARIDEPTTGAARTRANLLATEIAASAAAPGDLSNDQREALRRYTGWGGLSIDRVRARLPEGWVPNAEALIHEYYTPAAVAQAIADQVCPLLDSIATPDGELLALEPSAGVGRFIDAFDRCSPHPEISWLAVEASANSGRILGLVRPGLDLEITTFERWIARNGAALQGRIGLVVANPPYGERGPDADDDPDPEYAERRAADYFLRRGLDLLTPGGIGVFVVPGGFLTGPTRALRRKVLLRHHLAAAFRMPPQLFPGTGKQLVIDVLVFRSRGGELSEVDEADTFILEGDYFRQFPNHDLSTQTAFAGLPPLVERPTCALCVVRPFQWKRGGAPRPGAQPILAEDEAEKALPPELRAALSIGRRVRRYHAAFAAGEPVAAEIFPELRADLDALAASTDTLAAVRKLATTGNINAEALAQSFDRLGNVALAPPGPSATRYSGLPQDVVAQAEALYKDRRRLTIDALLDFHRERGGTVDRDEALRALFDADWNLDGAGLDELVPLADYTTGDLWPKHDRLAALQNAPPQVARQLSRLREAIGPAEFVDIQAISPRQGWVPIELVGAWLGQLYAWGEPLALGRRKGLVQIEGTSYSELEDHVPRAEAFWAIGYLNHDPVYFRPKSDPPQPPGPLPPGSNAPTTPLWEPDPTRPDRDDKVPADEYRRRWIVFWEAHFYAWLRADAGRREAIAEAYNRAFRGFVARQYSSEPLTIARWGDAITLERHQTMGARRILDQRGGLLAFDVGVGKTFTAVAVVARARQEGWARRPVVLVPSSLVWKWKRDFERCLPDYRVAVIGSQRHRLTRGKTAAEAKRLLAAGQISREEAEAMLQTSKPDTPQQRATKWRDFQAGAYDVVILSFDALPRTRVMPETVERYLGQTQEVLRSIELTLRSAAGKPEKDLTERQKAIKSLGLRGWFQNKLKTPKNQPPDPGIVWEELGVDLLVVDEAAAFKNLYMAEPREGGKPRYMGGVGGEGSKRAWNFDFRAAAVRERTGGAGVVLLSATPAKNSPLEFYNMIQFIDRGAWRARGIMDPEQFIDRYCRISFKPVVTPSFEIETRPAVVGFTNLDELRAVIFRYAEFRTAREVGIRLPTPRVFRCEVELDPSQRAKYDIFVAQIIADLKKGSATNILGFLARLSLVALHAEADEGYSWANAEGGVARRNVSPNALPHYEQRGWTLATSSGSELAVERSLPPPDPNSPKFVAIARRVAAQPTCGHIIFCEPTACHKWLRQVLVDHGIDEARIAVLNADNTSASQRVDIARAFNGEEGEPLYDVVIANSVAYEGVDLQVRTCAIHHADLTWTPADLEQRNGRGFRQGNSFNAIEIYYYLAKGSMDIFRFDLINGKSTWLSDLVEGNRETNNPAADAELSPDEILVALSGDPAKTARALEERRAREQAARREEIRIAANRLLRRASARFRDARRTLDMERAKALREEGERILAQLSRYDAEVWPFEPWMYAARDHLVFLTAPDGIPLYDGLRLGSEVEPGSFVEIGRPIDAADPDAAQKIAVREAGSARWHARHPSDLGSTFGVASFGLAAQWPADDDAKMVREARELAANSTLETLLGATFDGASEAFRARVWPEIADRVRAAAAGERLRLPAIEGDALRLVEGAVPAGVELLPWTQEGYARFLSLSPASGLSGYELNAVARLWWGQRIPPEVQRAADATARERKAAEEAAKKAEKGEAGNETPAPAVSPAEVEPAEAEPAPSAHMSEEGPSLGASIQAAVERRRAQQESEELDRIREAARDPGGYQELVAALGDLAGDIPTASDLATAWPTEWTSIREWIHNYLYSDRNEPEVDTRSKRRRARREPIDPSAYDLEALLTRIRDQIKDVEMRAEDALEVDQSGERERLLLRSGYLRGTASAGYYVMREDEAGVSRRYVRVVAGDRIDDDEIEIENIEHRGNEGPPLGPHDALYYYDSDEKDDDFLREIWGLYDKLATTLRKTPLALEQARKCLLLARALIDAPSCQGAAKEEATSLLRTALGYYRQARDRVNQGAYGAAYERLRRVARHVARQSQKLAESCAAGQGGLFGGPAIVDLSRISEEALAESDAAFEAEARAEAGEEADQA